MKETKMNTKEYNQLVKEREPKTKHIKTLVIAFLVGGLICVIGQIIADIVILINDTLTTSEVSNIALIILIFLGSLATGIGVYDKLGFYAGAGSIIPITGFANSIVAPAMEFNDEGIVFGIMSHLFAIAGPVFVSGIAASFVAGIIYLVFGLV